MNALPANPSYCRWRHQYYNPTTISSLILVYNINSAHFSRSCGPVILVPKTTCRTTSFPMTDSMVAVQSPGKPSLSSRLATCGCSTILHDMDEPILSNYSASTDGVPLIANFSWSHSVLVIEFKKLWKSQKHRLDCKNRLARQRRRGLFNEAIF